jgi:hypothetical protein
MKIQILDIYDWNWYSIQLQMFTILWLKRKSSKNIIELPRFYIHVWKQVYRSATGMKNAVVLLKKARD